jgi:hypothetical protein
MPPAFRNSCPPRPRWPRKQERHGEPRLPQGPGLQLVLVQSHSYFIRSLRRHRYYKT